MENQIEEQLSSLKKQISTAQERKLRATVESEQAEARLNESLKLLKDKFKTESIEDAVALMAKMEKGMQAKITEAENFLRESSGD